MMRQKIFLALLFITLLSAVSAQTQDELKGKILDFVGSNDAIMVMGTHSSSAERLLVMLTKDIYPDLDDMIILEEKEFDETVYPYQTIVLIGGPSQNMISKKVIDSDKAAEIEEFSGGRVVFIDRYMIYSDFAGFNNYPRTSQNKSPLASFFPIALVPVAATLASFSLLWLWNMLRDIFENLYHEIIGTKLMDRAKKKEVRKVYRGFDLHGVRIKYREWFFIILSAVIFSLSISYTYFTGAGMIGLIFTSLFVNILILAFQNLLRLFLDRHHQTHTEYHIWPFGAFLTIASGLLGNTFGLAGYISSEKSNEDISSKIQYKTVWFTFLFGMLFMIINIMQPFELAQMVMVCAVTSSFLQMLPMSPFSGKDIIKWNKGLWRFGFLSMLAGYVLVCLFF